MIEIKGNIWDIDCDWLCVTTNCIVDKKGYAVMGKGIALEAKQRYPEIPKILGTHIRQVPDEPWTGVIGVWQDGKKKILSFPTKYHWKDPSDLDLIEDNAKTLAFTSLRTFQQNGVRPIVLLPRLGCGNGGLDWNEVKLVIGPILDDDSFVIVNRN